MHLGKAASQTPLTKHGLLGRELLKMKRPGGGDVLQSARVLESWLHAHNRRIWKQMWADEICHRRRELVEDQGLRDWLSEWEGSRRQWKMPWMGFPGTKVWDSGGANEQTHVSLRWARQTSGTGRGFRGRHTPRCVTWGPVFNLQRSVGSLICSQGAPERTVMKCFRISPPSAQR